MAAGYYLLAVLDLKLKIMKKTLLSWILLFACVVGSGCNRDDVDKNGDGSSLFEYGEIDPSTEVIAEVFASDVISTDIIGFGWNIEPSQMPSSVNSDWNNAFVSADQSWIRMVLREVTWEAENDDNDPWTSPKDFSGFIWNEGGDGLNSKITRLLDLCNANNVDVQLCHWNCDPDYDGTGPGAWMNDESYFDNFGYEIGDLTYDKALVMAQEFGEHMAALIYYLKVEANYGLGYDCVKYYGLWNEPAQGVDNDFVSWDYPGFYSLMSNQVLAHLEYYDSEMGTNLVNEVQCMGVESGMTWRHSLYYNNGTATTYENIISDMLNGYTSLESGIEWPAADISTDFISIHHYNSTFEYDLNRPAKVYTAPSGDGTDAANGRTIGNNFIPSQVQIGLEQIAMANSDKGRQTRLIANELGSHILGYKDIAARFEHMLLSVNGFTRALSEGVVGGSVWCYNSQVLYSGYYMSDAWYFGSNTDVSAPASNTVVPENYYLWKLFCSAVQKGDNVLKLTIDGGVDDSKDDDQEWGTYESWGVEAQRVYGVAVEGSLKHKVVIVNDSYLPKTIAVKHKSMSGAITREVVSHANVDSGVMSRKITITDGIISDEIEARSVVVYTSYK